jgi:hypothetical protein
VTSPGKTSRMVFVPFFGVVCHFLHRGFILLFLCFIPRKGRGEKGPRGPSVDTDGVED